WPEAVCLYPCKHAHEARVPIRHRPKYVKKIESVVRKRGVAEEPTPESTSCPYCSNSVRRMNSIVSDVKESFPIACRFPAFEDQLKALASEEGGKCLMCGTEIRDLSECRPYQFEEVRREEEDQEENGVPRMNGDNSLSSMESSGRD
ncbi:Uncharacterized protein FKW44_022082, partial [Caligus rogercresseyi]